MACIDPFRLFINVQSGDVDSWFWHQVLPVFSCFAGMPEIIPPGTRMWVYVLPFHQNSFACGADGIWGAVLQMPLCQQRTRVALDRIHLLFIPGGSTSSILASAGLSTSSSMSLRFFCRFAAVSVYLLISRLRF